MSADSDLTHVLLDRPSTRREQLCYSDKHKSSSWTDNLLPRKLLRKSEEGNDWLKGVAICTSIAGLILVINIIMAITATALAYSRQSNHGRFQMVEMYNGQCTRSSRWATGLHVVINVLSTFLLGASNYVMQSLGAPSRDDIDQAHSQSRWLDIGTFSFRNFAIMNRRRKILWMLLLISSTPIHMIYNSVVFSSISTYRYGSLMIPHDLSPTEPLINDDKTALKDFQYYVGPDQTIVRDQIFNGSFINATTEDCFAKYDVEFNTKYGTLIFVADRKYFHNTSSFRMIWTSTPTYLSLYDAVQGSIGEMTNWTTSGCYWSYRVWNYSIFDPIQGDRYWFNFDDYYSEFDKIQVTSAERYDTELVSYDSSYDASSNSLHDDLETLASYNYAYNPSHDALREYLDTPSHWANSSWAADVTFEQLEGGYISSSYWFQNPTLLVTPMHCLYKEEEQQCQLSFSPPIAIAVIACNVIKVFCMLLTARVKRKDLMLTVGDALASFLTRPDPTTLGRCLLSHEEMTKGPQAWRLPVITFGRLKGYTLQPRAPSPPAHSLDDLPARSGTEVYPGLLPQRKRWYQAASWKRWMAVLLFFISCIITTICLLVRAINVARSFKSAMDLGFAQTSNDNMIKYLSTNMIALVLLANTPQIILSILYFLTNSLLTCMLVAAEWDKYARHRRPLRVSWPRGKQRSTYYLSLPYRYSIPLLVLSATLHWLLSQSIFFVNIKIYNLDTSEDKVTWSRGCCYSPMAMFITLWVGILALGLLLGVGARRFSSHMPLATHCSAAISAACHPPESDEGAALKPVMWGEIPRVDMPEATTEYEGAAAATRHSTEHAHCSFTSLDALTPSLVRLYC